MSVWKPTVNYSGFMPRQNHREEYRHCKYWLFWPILGIRYVFIERFYPVEQYFTMHHPLDDLIPFREEFIIPYLFWYIFMFGMHLYLFFHDVDGFTRYSKFLCTAMTISTITFMIFPTCQELRPAAYPRSNKLTTAVRILHTVDTNTNVCPSEHVIGSLAVVFASMHNQQFKQPKKLLAVTATAFVICASTLFLKQHSVIDVAAALPVCIAAYWLTYKDGSQKARSFAASCIKRVHKKMRCFTDDRKESKIC